MNWGTTTFPDTSNLTATSAVDPPIFVGMSGNTRCAMTCKLSSAVTWLSATFASDELKVNMCKLSTLLFRTWAMLICDPGFKYT